MEERKNYDDYELMANDTDESEKQGFGWKELDKKPKAVFIIVTVYILIILLVNIFIPSFSSTRWGLILLLPAFLFLGGGFIYIKKKNK